MIQEIGEERGDMSKDNYTKLVKEYWDKARVFHGHECPGLAIGVKACEAVIEKMGVGASPDEELVCVTENDACCVDAIQSILSCTFGKGNLIYRGTGKMAFNFFERKSGKKLRVYYKFQKPPLEDREQFQNFVLHSPPEELFDFSEPKFELPEAARIFKSLICDECGEKAPEHKMRLHDGKTVCLDCFRNYDRGFDTLKL